MTTRKHQPHDKKKNTGKNKGDLQGLEGLLGSQRSTGGKETTIPQAAKKYPDSKAFTFKLGRDLYFILEIERVRDSKILSVARVLKLTPEDHSLYETRLAITANMDIEELTLSEFDQIARTVALEALNRDFAFKESVLQNFSRWGFL